MRKQKNAIRRASFVIKENRLILFGALVMLAWTLWEGFGTLDENALRNALELLSRLADGDRLIGIISHMPELRDRIDKKIVVRKHLWGAQATIEA